MVKGLDDLFPGLKGSGYQITSPPDGDYNCIAWAAGDGKRWWWPDQLVHHVWPAGVPFEETLAAFEAAFASLGYVACTAEGLEAGFEKVALFANAQGVPLHAARQLPSGRWTSKLGELEDIKHALRELEGVEYGTVVLLMKRRLPAAPAANPPP